MNDQKNELKFESLTERSAQLEQSSFAASLRLSSLIDHLCGPRPCGQGDGDALSGVMASLERASCNLQGILSQLDHLEMLIGNKLNQIMPSQPSLSVGAQHASHAQRISKSLHA